MDRRSFFKTMIGGVAATAAVRTWPFRVYSFPTEIVAPAPFIMLESTAHGLAHYNEILARHAWTGFDEPNLVWMESAAYRTLLRKMRAEGKLPRQQKVKPFV